MKNPVARLQQGLEQIKKKNFHTWTPGYLRWLAQSAVPRARAAIDGHGSARGICSSRSATTTSRSGRTRIRCAARSACAPGARAIRPWSARSATPTGVAPRHSFFFPGEQYRPAYLDALATLARGGLGEVELHLHHDGDTADNLRRTIGEYLDTYAKHGHLSRDRGGRLRYAFIHGNWCLANARSDGRWCGVDEEIPLLFETGCYADFTFPAAPDESQPNIVNQIYWPEGDLARRRALRDRRARRASARCGAIAS